MTEAIIRPERYSSVKQRNANKAVSVSQLAGYRTVRGPHFGTAHWPAVALCDTE